MSDNPLDPQFIFPVDKSGIFFYPSKAKYLLSERPVKRGSVIRIGTFETTVKHTEDLTILIFPQAGKMRISKGYMEISSIDGVNQFIEFLGFGDRQSFLRSVCVNYTIEGYSIKRKLLLHHLYEHTIIPSL